MKIVAITGSIGCGKTTLADQVRGLGYCVYDVDGWVRRLYFRRDFLSAIEQNFPGTVVNGRADKRKLREIVFNNEEKRKKLESLIHPFLRETLKRLIYKNYQYEELFFIDIALLFEMGWDKYCDYVIVADVDYEVQKQRVMRRDRISGEDFDKINNVQLSNDCKKLLADVVIDTDRPLNLLRADLMCIIDGLKD